MIPKNLSFVLWLICASAAGCYRTGATGNAVMDAGTDTDSDADTDSDTDADSDTETDSETEWETDTQCAGHYDFTPCELLTDDPDCAYDICVRGACVSPGCDEAMHNVPGPHFPPPDTGQRLCYDADGAYGEVDGGTNDGGTSCPSGGDPFFGQDAQYGWDTVHDPAARFTRDTSAAGAPVVFDDLTGLVWQGCGAGLTGDACEVGSVSAASYSWALSYCEALSWAGYDDWRIPDEFELQSIMEYGSPGFGIFQIAFPNLEVTALWSSSAFVISEKSADDYQWCLSGGFIGGCSRVYPFGVLCVSGVPTPVPPRFDRDTSVPGQPVVADAATGLAWQGCADGRSGDDCDAGAAEARTWEEALALCEELSWGGFDDWRLPNAKELQSIVDHHTHDPAIDATAFPETPSDPFWSSTTLEYWSTLLSADAAWFTDFELGSSDSIFGSDKSSELHVRCVRGGE